MSTLKDKLLTSKHRLSHFFRRSTRGIASRWRGLTPGFRYALVYFICVVCIASVVWWQFSPSDSLVFDPNANLEPEAPGDSDPMTPDDSSPDSEDIPDAAVFSPERGDKLLLPLEGEILASFGDPFYKFPGWTTGGIDGIHIDGTAGDAVVAAWQGVISEVIPADSCDLGEVTIKHGEWTTVYKNLGEIFVSPGQSVDAGQKVGELSAKLFGSYSGDYLEFQLWGPNDLAYDPWEYSCVNR